LKAITESDLVILATPIYTNFMTASLKLVLDRLRPLQTGGYRLNRRGDFAPVLKSSKAYHFLLVATCGFPEIKTFNTLETWFDHFVDQYDEFGMAGKILLPAAPVVMKTGPIRNRFYAELDKHLMHLTSRTYFEVKKEWIGKEEIIEAMKRVNVFESHSE
jgi:multimeric flavodoxin WrbA